MITQYKGLHVGPDINNYLPRILSLVKMTSEDYASVLPSSTVTLVYFAPQELNVSFVESKSILF